jgi:hypothetical protein
MTMTIMTAPSVVIFTGDQGTKNNTVGQRRDNITEFAAFSPLHYTCSDTKAPWCCKHLGYYFQ